MHTRHLAAIASAFLFLIISIGCHQQQNTSNSYQSALANPSWYNASEMDTITVVTWNVEHFLDDFDNPYIDNDREDQLGENMEERRNLLARALKKLDADIVVFQEIESDSYVRHFANDHLSDMGYEVFAALESPDWYMNVVAMSKIPLGMFYSYAHAETPILGETGEDGEQLSQSFINNRMWSVDVHVSSDYQFTLTGVHLKAGRGDRNIGWRKGQINLITEWLETLQRHEPERNQLIVGDLNATPDSEEMKLLTDRIHSPIFVDPLAGTNVYSHPSDSSFWRIDHILPNQKMNRELVAPGIEVVYPLGDSTQYVSDHLPVLGRFVTSEQ